MTEALPLWASLLYNEPMAISLFSNEVLCQVAQTRMMRSSPTRIDATALAGSHAMSHDASHYTDQGRKPFPMKNGIAVIQCFGKMSKRGGWMDADSGMIGYDTLLRQLRAAHNDPEVAGTFLMMDSPGGHVARLFETANEIAMLTEQEGGKPIYCYLDEEASSAAYVVASACDVILGPRSCVGGSLGVIMNMLDVSRLYEDAGINPVVIRSSWADRKARPQDGEKIDSDTIDKMQALVDESSTQLLEFVTAMRGVPEKTIKDMRGEVFHGPELFRRGLLDEVCSEREAWTLLEDHIRSR